MSKRKQRREQGASWLEEDSQPTTSLEEATIAGFGLDIPPAGQRIVVQPVSIFKIEPDLAQPRRAVPSTVRANWDGTADDVPSLLNAWVEAIEAERGTLLDLTEYLDREYAEGDEEPLETTGPVEQAFARIALLAVSIRRDGLTNPITIAKQGRDFRLETGERRWLSYHLLYAWFNGEEGRPDERETWEAIPARKVDAIDVWRQASENNARADLNAIGKARQYAVLMMALHPTASFKPINLFQSDREFYAQAAELSTPYGKRDDLLNALGVTSPSVLTRLRHLLQLPDEIWYGADDHNLPEDFLDKLYQVAQRDRAKAIEMYRQKIVLNQNDSASTISIGQNKVEAEQVGSKGHFATILRTLGRTGEDRPQDNSKALNELRALRRWIEEQEERIQQFTS
jgi:hypothetical protein